MVVDILTRNSKIRPNSIGVLEIDGTIDEEHSFTSQIPEQPIEEGANINDHITNNPEKINIQGFLATVFVETAGGFTDRISEGFETLRNIWREKQQVTVVSSLTVYQNMSIVNLNFPRNIRNFNNLRFSIELVNVRTIPIQPNVVGSEDLEPGFVRDGASQAIERGRQAVFEPDNEVEQAVTDVITEQFIGN